MSANSKIEWTDHTFNPWRGCTKVSPGCEHCYAETLSKRNPAVLGQWGKGKPRVLASEAMWREPLRWNGEAEKWQMANGRRPRVFCASLADWLDEEVPIEWLARLLKLIHATPHLDWLLLTKRPENWKERIEAAFHYFASGADDRDWMMPWLDAWLSGLKPSNVWIGTTAEDQTRAEERIRRLLLIPAKVRFLSCEPLLSCLDLPWLSLRRIDGDWHPFYALSKKQMAASEMAIHWVICGGESGGHARPMHPEWARSLREQCAAAGVPFFFKQWGEWSPRAKICGAGEDFQSIDPQCKIWPDVIRLGEHGKNTLYCENCTDDMGEEVFVQKVGKKRAGRLLDGVEHNAFPA